MARNRMKTSLRVGAAAVVLGAGLATSAVASAERMSLRAMRSVLDGVSAKSNVSLPRARTPGPRRSPGCAGSEPKALAMRSIISTDDSPPSSSTT